MAPERGDLVRDFSVTTVDGSRFEYAGIWQRRNLLLVSLPAMTSPVDRAYASDLTSRVDEWAALETACVITRECVLDLPQGAVIIADRWGEIYFVQAGSSVADLPNVAAILEWLQSIQHECPECQGESR